MHYFYTIKNLKGRPGFGITGNPYSRLKDYISHAGEELEFVKLYQGFTPHIKALESQLKTLYVDERWKVDEWVTEWLDNDYDYDHLERNIVEILENRPAWKISLFKEQCSLDDIILAGLS